MRHGSRQGPPSCPRRSTPTGPLRGGRLALSGAVAFWSADLVISLTPLASAYRSAMSIQHVPMLVEAAAGGLLVASAVALVLVRYPGRVPGTGPLRKALLLSAGALVLLTVFVELPSTLRSGVADPGYWLYVATLFNAVRVLALGMAIGLIARAARVGPVPHPPVTERGEQS